MPHQPTALQVSARSRTAPNPYSRAAPDCEIAARAVQFVRVQRADADHAGTPRVQGLPNMVAQPHDLDRVPGCLPASCTLTLCLGFHGGPFSPHWAGEALEEHSPCQPENYLGALIK